MQLLSQYGRQLLITISTAASLALSTTTLGLGMSEIELHSKLGEPLAATLHLIDAAELENREIIIRQAPKDAYLQLGVEPSARFQQLRFSMAADKTVSITTREAIKEPFLNFVLEAHWPEGRLFKEFKLLIDP